MTATAAAVYPEPALADTAARLFAALDGVRISNRFSTWVTHVTSVHADGANIWVQLAPAGDEARSIVLQLSPWATAERALTALQSIQLGHPRYRQVLTVH